VALILAAVLTVAEPESGAATIRRNIVLSPANNYIRNFIYLTVMVDHILSLSPAPLAIAVDIMIGAVAVSSTT